MIDIMERARLREEEIEYCDLQDPITCYHCLLRTAEAQLKKAIPIIREDERRKIIAIASFTVRLEGNTVIADRHDWDNLWDYLEGKSPEEVK